MKNSSIFRSLIITASLSTIVILAALASLLYFGTMTPMEKMAKTEALDTVRQKLNLHLRSKEDSVLSIAASLARDSQIRKALRENRRELAVGSLTSLTEDYAEITDYRMIRAQVIDTSKIIIARSWDLDFFGEPAPHPMIDEVIDKRAALASFGLGNAGVGIIGFAPIIENDELIGIVSVTQGVGSVVRSMQEDQLEWVLLLSKSSILERFSGHYPSTLATLPSMSDAYFLAHPEWFDLYLAAKLEPELPSRSLSQTNTAYFDDKILYDFPLYDQASNYIGRSLVLGEKEAILSRIENVRSATFLLIAATLIVVTCVVALLLLLVKRRILHPVQHIISVINQTISSGRFSNRVRVHRQDELGLMTQNFNSLLANIERGLNESNRVMSQLALGDFEQRIEGHYQGDLLEMKNGINAAARELKESRRKVILASQAKSQFLANMSHEIRTPINGVIGMLSLLETTDLTTEQAEQVHLAMRSAELLLGLINDILDFSKIEAGKMTLEVEPVHLTELINTLHQLFKHQADEKQIDFIQQLDPHLPEWIKGDSLRIRQILNNLLSNAIKFTDSGTVSLSAELNDDNQQLCLAVRDTGIGISHDAQERLFRSFSQADNSTSRKYGGTGLGLMISKQLIELMQGRLWLESEAGRGSCFYIEIPYIACEPPPQQTLVKNHFVNYSDRSVLLVEDNLVNQKLALKLLEKFNINATLAHHGQEAIDLLETQAYDLILMDCQMPIMDGYRATHIIRKRDIMTPIAALTANASEEDRKQCLACGMNDFLSKPYNIQNMSDLLARWLK